MKKEVTFAGIVALALGFLVPAAVLCHADSADANPAQTPLVARVNGKPIGGDLLQEKIKQLYPTSSVHGRGSGSPELRQKALDEVVLDELIWQEAVSAHKVVPLPEAHQELLRVRRRYGVEKFDADVRLSGLTRQQYEKKLQRAMTIRQARKEHVELPAQIGPKAVRTYYDSNKNRFRRPERARFRLILVAVAPDASKEVEQEARKKAEGLYAQLQAGRDFAELAYESSDDIYRATGGDVGWMHKGSMDPEFEPLALSLPIGQATAPFRTPLGYNILKVEARESAKDMNFAEIRDKLRAQLTAQRSKQLQQAWEVELKRSAKIEIFDPNETPKTSAPMTSLERSH